MNEGRMQSILSRGLELVILPLEPCYLTVLEPVVSRVPSFPRRIFMGVKEPQGYGDISGPTCQANYSGTIDLACSIATT